MKKIVSNQLMKVLMICTGNICRSPMAEGIYQSLTKANHKNVRIDSAGTHGYHINQPPDSRAIKTMKKHGIDISHYRARAVNHEDLLNFDYILVATDEHLNFIQSLAAKNPCTAKIEKMLITHPHLKNHDLYDPYYGDIEDFEVVFEQLYLALSERLKNE